MRSCEIRRSRRVAKVKSLLCLGVSYPDFSAYCEDKQTIDAILALVQSGRLTQMDGRDLARCVAAEEECNCKIYTVSQETGARYKTNRHIYANFNRQSFIDKSLTKLLDADGFATLDQVILDYFWIPSLWDVHHWQRSFFSKTLPKLATVMTAGSGCAYLPFTLHCFLEVLVNKDLLDVFEISFVRDNDLGRIWFWKGTQSLDPKSMQEVLGKRLQQEEIYCKFGPQQLAEASEHADVTKQELLCVLRSLEDFDRIRFIQLRRLGKRERGKFVGLTSASQVKRGFDHLLARTPSRTSKQVVSKRLTFKTKRSSHALKRKLFQETADHSPKQVHTHAYPTRSKGGESPFTLVDNKRTRRRLFF